MGPLLFITLDPNRTSLKPPREPIGLGDFQMSSSRAFPIAIDREGAAIILSIKLLPSLTVTK